MNVTTDLWNLGHPTSRPTSKQLLVQCTNIRKKITGRYHHPRHLRLGTKLNRCVSARAADLRDKIVAKLETLRARLPRLCKVPSDGLAEGVNAALWTIPTAAITETSQLIYTTAAVIIEMLGYKTHSNKEQYPPWRKKLEVKIKAAWREVGQLSEMGCLRSTASYSHLRP